MAEEIEKEPGFLVTCSTCGWNSRHVCEATNDHTQHIRAALYEVLGEIGVFRAEIDGAIESLSQRVRDAQRKVDFETRSSYTRINRTVPAKGLGSSDVLEDDYRELIERNKQTGS